MKQRLVGAVVLGCLALIFLPILLDGEGIDESGITSNIPPPPPVPPVPDTAPERPAVATQDETAPPPAPSMVEGAGESAPQPADDANADEEVEPSTEEGGPGKEVAEATGLDEGGLPAAWSVRLASFAQADNASRLVKELRGQGYKGYSRELSSARGELIAVFVGPVTSRDEADALRRRLESEFNLSGLVVRFTVDQPEDSE